MSRLHFLQTLFQQRINKIPTCFATNHKLKLLKAFVFYCFELVIMIKLYKVIVISKQRCCGQYFFYVIDNNEGRICISIK